MLHPAGAPVGYDLGEQHLRLGTGLVAAAAKGRRGVSEECGKREGGEENKR